jgi:Uncharacterized membrane-bound protein
MIRLLAFILLVLVLGFGFAWLADRPGDIAIAWQGRRIEMSLMVAVTAIVSLIAAVMLSWWLVKIVINSPRAVTRYFRANKRDRGYQALSTGLIAAGAGDAASARKLSKRAKGLISADQEPLIHLLDVQAALIEGRDDEARALLEAMSEDPETRLLGLRGLYLEARRLGAEEAARHYADRAAQEAPQLAWAGEAALANRTREGRWDEALKLLDRQKLVGLYERKDAERKKAVLLTARAMAKADADPAGARDDGLAALKLAPGFVPAALVAAKALFREDNLRKGSKILEAVWRDDPHPAIAETYVRARVGDTMADRLKRAQKLEAMRPNHAESLFAVARAALDARRFDLAREKAEAAARLAPREGIYLLMADIEEAETGDQGRVRHWLAQALKAPRDPAWTADGYVSETWQPISPVSGRLDAFEWKVPLAQLAGGTIEHGARAESFEEAAAALPPVAAEPPPPRETVIDIEPERPTEHESAAPEPAPVTGAPAAEEPAPALQVKEQPAEATALAREAAFLHHPPDDPGVDSEAEPESKQRFRLF